MSCETLGSPRSKPWWTTFLTRTTAAPASAGAPATSEEQPNGWLGTWLETRRKIKSRRRFTRSSCSQCWKEVGVADRRHRNDDDDTEEIPHVPHRKLGTKVDVIGDDQQIVPDPTSWRPCPCSATDDHT